MPKTIHMSFSVRGGLFWDDDEWRENIAFFSDDNGKKMTIEQAKTALMDELAQGREVIPLGACDNFDYLEGCLGHETIDDEPIIG